MALAKFLVAAMSAARIAAQSTGTNDTAAAPFNITNFQAGALELSNRAEYRFTLAYAVGADSLDCERLTTTPNEMLVNVSMTQCGANSTVFFQWIQANDGSAELKVVNMDGDYNVTAIKAINSSDIVVVLPNTEFAHQAYNGTANFSMAVTEA